MKQFEIPSFYKSPIIGRVKAMRKLQDPRKRDFSPHLLDFGPVRVLLPRHFGFCYGVENAIEIAFRTLEQHPDRNVFLLSEMIHNPRVNADLQERGIRFIMDTSGKNLIPWESLTSDDIVLIPAFGTTLEIQARLDALGIATESYNTTCPFVEKVWKTSAKLGGQDYTVVIHGKFKHEETRATFSHSKAAGMSVVVEDMAEAQHLARFIDGSLPASGFAEAFGHRCAPGFDPEKHLARIGVVNQTTMLASDTQAIADYLKGVMRERYGEESLAEHFADTRDTLCYATNDNQRATVGMLEHDADVAFVVGGYNSSNTTHLAELCATRVPTYFIEDAGKMMSESLLSHYDWEGKQEATTEGYLPKKQPTTIMVTSGASCPDITLDEVLHRLLSFFPGTRPLEEVLGEEAAR
jgi:4-hydroxy-3-methylbut-2-enyl diphosphate reductase